MYSSLFSAGLVQLWDTDSPQHSPLQGTFPKHRPHASTSSALLKSFLSFDDSTLRHQPTSAHCSHPSDKGAVISNADNDHRVFMRASSPSRRSMDSAVTLPTRSGTYRSRSGTRRESGRLTVPRHTVFSTATSSGSFFAFYPPSSSDSSSPPKVPTIGLTRRRSLPSAKPAPSAVPLPSVPAAGPSSPPLSQMFSSSHSAAGRRKLKQTSPWRSTKGGKDTRTSFVPSESSSGSSTNTISYGVVSSPRKELSKMGNFQQPPRGDRLVGNANISSTQAKIPDQSSSLGEDHSNFRCNDITSRAPSRWALPQIRTSDFRLSIPSIPSPTSPPRRDTTQSPSPSPTSSQQPAAASPLSPSSSSIHSLQSIQSMQSMLESTSSTSTVTLDELAEADAALDVAGTVEDDHGGLGLGQGTNASAAAGEDDMDLGVEDGLQSFRVSFDLEALGLDAAIFDPSLTFGTADANDEISTELFPVSVHGSSGSEGSGKVLPGRHSTFSSVRSRSTVHSRQTLLGLTSSTSHVDEAESLSPPNRNPRPPPSPAEQLKMKVLADAASFPLDLAALKGLSEIPSPPGTIPSFDDKVLSNTIEHRLMTSSSISLPTPPSNAADAWSDMGLEAKRDVPAVQFDRASTIGRASTVASTRYKEGKRSDALAQLEGRAFQNGYQFAPPHLKPSTSTSVGGAKTKSEMKRPKNSFLPTEEDEEAVGGDHEGDEIKSISVTSFLPAGSGSGSSSSQSTLTISTHAGDINGSQVGGSGYAHSEWGLSFGPGRHDKRRTRRVMMLTNTAFVRVAGDLEGLASRSSPALLSSTQQQRQHFRSHSNGNTGGSSHSPSGSFASSDVSTSISSHVASNTLNSHDGLQRQRGRGIPLSTQSTASSGASSFACTGMAWSEGGFVSFIDSDSEGGTTSPSAHKSIDKDTPSSPGLFSKMARKEKKGATGMKTIKEKLRNREKPSRKAAEMARANSQRRDPTTSTSSFIDMR